MTKIKWSDLITLSELSHDTVEYEKGKERICDLLKKSPKQKQEVGIVILMNDDGEWEQSDVMEGQSDHVSYDFSEYYSRDPEINAGFRFPQGTVHYHPKVDDTEKNYLPSLGDIWNSIEMARETGNTFGCGVINHQRIGTLSFPKHNAYKDIGLGKIVDRYNEAMDENNRKEVLQIEEEAIDYLTSSGLMEIGQWKCDEE